MDKALTILFLALCFCHLVDMSPVSYNGTLENQTVNNDVGNVYPQDEPEQTYNTDYVNTLIEEVKARILRNLHKKEAPKTYVPLPALQPLHFRHDSRCNETVGQPSLNSTKRTRSEFLYANVGNATCFDENGNSCLRFHFELPQVLQNKNFESIELWLYKKQNVTEFSITRIITNDDDDEEKEENERLTTILYNQTYSKGWIRFNVSQMFRNENITAFGLEVSSTKSEEWCLESEGNKTPFLLVRVEDKHISKRSANDCTTENSTCCREIYYVNFSDMGWGDWIVQPEGIDANYCRGICTNHAGLPLKPHGTILNALCEKHPKIAREIGKTDCIACSPIGYQSKSVIYLDNDGVRVVSHMADMSVTRCGCI